MKKYTGVLFLLALLVITLPAKAVENEGISVVATLPSPDLVWGSDEHLVGTFKIEIKRSDLVYVGETKIRLDRTRGGVTEDVTTAVKRVRVQGEMGALDGPIDSDGPTFSLDWLTWCLSEPYTGSVTMEVYVGKDRLQGGDTLRTTLVELVGGTGQSRLRIPIGEQTVFVVHGESSGGGGTQLSEPRPPAQLPGVELDIIQQNGVSYRRFELPEGGIGWWCFVRLTEPLPENVAVWWDSNWSGQYPVPSITRSGSGTHLVFPLSAKVSHLSSERVKEIAEVQFFELSGP